MTSRLTVLPFTESGVYKIENTKNGKLYVGCASVFGSRWDKHKWQLRNNCHHSDYLQRAWNKYGEEAFEFKVLKICPIEKLAEEETKYFEITRCQNRKFGYNIAGPGSHRIVSEETKRKIGAAFKGKKLTNEHRNKIREGLKKAVFRPMSEEGLKNLRRANFARAMKDRCLSDEQLKNLVDSYHAGETGEIIGRRLGISKSYVYAVASGRMKTYFERMTQLGLKIGYRAV